MLLNITEKWLKVLEENKVIGVVFIILLKKLQALDVNNGKYDI